MTYIPKNYIDSKSITEVRSVYITNQSLTAFVVAQNGITHVKDNIVLLTKQTTASQNGIYILGTVTSGLAVLSRVSWASLSSDFYPGMTIKVSSEDNANGNTSWALTTPLPITLGSTSLTFIRIENTVDVRWFGAVPITNNGTGSNSGTAINTALTAANAAHSSGHVRVTLAGYEYITDGITINVLDRTILCDGTLQNNALVAATGTYPTAGWTPSSAIVNMGNPAGGGLCRPAGVENVRVKSGTSTGIGIVGFRIDTLARGCWIQNCFADLNSHLVSGVDTYQQIGVECVVSNFLDTSFLNPALGTGLYQCRIDMFVNGGHTGAKFSTRGSTHQNSLDHPDCDANWIRLVVSGVSTYGIWFDAGANENMFDLRCDTWDNNSINKVPLYFSGGRNNHGVLREEIGAGVGTQYTIRELNGSWGNRVEYTTQGIVTSAVDVAGVVGGSRSLFEDKLSAIDIGAQLVTTCVKTFSAVPDDSTIHDQDQIFGPFPAPVLISYLTARLDAILTAGAVTVYAARNGDPNEGISLVFTAGEGTFKYTAADAIAGAGSTNPFPPGFYLEPGEVMKFQYKNAGSGVSQPINASLVGRFIHGPGATVDPRTIQAPFNFTLAWYSASKGMLNSSGALITSGTTTIATARDLSGREINGTQGTDANRPTYLASGTNSQPGMTFSGSQWLTSSTGLTSGYNAQPQVIYLVFAATDTVAAYTLLDSDNATTCRISTQIGGGVTVDCGGTAFNSSVFDTTQPTVLCVSINGSSSVVEVNAAQLGSSFNPGTNGLHGITLGAKQDHTGGFKGTIYQCIVLYDGGLGSIKRGRISKWLMSSIGTN